MKKEEGKVNRKRRGEGRVLWEKEKREREENIGGKERRGGEGGNEGRQRRGKMANRIIRRRW